jgi:hypothetical protein
VDEAESMKTIPAMITAKIKKNTTAYAVLIEDITLFSFSEVRIFSREGKK